MFSFYLKIRIYNWSISEFKLEVYIQSLLFRPLKMGMKFVFGCFLVFSFFIFHIKSGITNNHRTGLSDVSY